MKTTLIVKALLVVILQTVVFLGIWALMVSVARSQDRFPPELFFGITIYYGTIWVVCLFAVCGGVALLAHKALVRWSTIIAGLLIWLVWLWPSFDSRPYAMPCFFALGALILVIGSGFGIPLMRRAAKRKTIGESGRREVLTPAPHTTGHTGP